MNKYISLLKKRERERKRERKGWAWHTQVFLPKLLSDKVLLPQEYGNEGALSPTPNLVHNTVGTQQVFGDFFFFNG